jgi:hypothetical protein
MPKLLHSLSSLVIGTAATIFGFSTPSFAQTTLFFQSQGNFVGSFNNQIGGQITTNSFITLNQFNSIDDIFVEENILDWSIETTPDDLGQGGFVYTPQTSRRFSFWTGGEFNILNVGFEAFQPFPNSSNLFPEFDILNPNSSFFNGNNIREFFRTSDFNNDGIPDGAFTRQGRVQIVNNPPTPGTTPNNPILPTPNPGFPGFTFPNIPVVPRQTFFFDPEVAIGYDYTVTGGPLFASVLIPTALPNGDSNFTLELGSFGNFPLVAGTPFNLLGVNPSGFNAFRISGIDTNEQLDPTNPTAFVTGLSFTDAGTVNLTQTPIVQNIATTPETTSVLSFFALGLVGAASILKRKLELSKYSEKELVKVG